MKLIKNISLIIVSIGLFSSCVGMARLSDFPKTSESYDFDELSKQNYEYDGFIWNQKTEYEYFVEVEKINENELFVSITQALIQSGYDIVHSDKQKRAVIGKRGMRANEWSSITGVYYKPYEAFYQVFFKNAITQDFTGGWRENRAKKVALVLCSELGKCKGNKK